jgi:predicted RNA-binding Zn ribbon-like protein
MRQPREAETHRLIGGDLCLNFVNTLNGHSRPSPHEYLHDYRDLALWSRHAGLLTIPEARSLLKCAAAKPALAGAVYRKTIRLREVLFRIFYALALGQQPPPDDLDRLNTAWREAQRHARIIRAADGFALDWDDDRVLERITRTICASAIDLLTSDKAARIRACNGLGCDWLFVDTSRNHLRRWCSMDECGNRAKMRRRQNRKKPAASSQLHFQEPEDEF